MSTSIRRKKFECFNDCNSMGCPGHILTIRYHNTSDTITILMDDELMLVCDDGLLNAVCDLHRMSEKAYDESDFGIYGQQAEGGG